MKTKLVACLMFGVAIAAHGQIGGSTSRDKASQARSVKEVMSILGIPKPEAGNQILLETPDIVAQGKKATIKVISKIPGTDWIAVLVERKDLPLQLAQDFSPGIDHAAELSIELTRTSRVQALVRASGKYYQVSREVKVATPGCDKK